MAYPILAAQETWFAPTITSITKAIITEIDIKDSYTPEAGVTVVDSWDASAAQDGSITCYVIGTKLIIAGNGSGKIATNPNSVGAFRKFSSMVSFNNAHLLDTSIAEDLTQFLIGNVVCTYIDVSTWDTSKCTSMVGVFTGNKALLAIDVSNWDVSRVTNLGNMFGLCSAVKVLDVSNWDVSNCTSFNGIFMNCSAVEELDVSQWHIDASKTDEIQVPFSNCAKLKKLDLRNWPMAKVMINTLFTGCSALEEVLLPDDWLVGRTSASKMFNEKSFLKTVNVENWDTSSVEDMSFMFYGCSSLKEIDVSNWDVSKVKSFDHFAAHANLKRKGIENWNTSSATNMNALFHNCAEEELDLSGWDVSKVQYFSQMFENSPNLKRIKGLEKWNTSAGIGFDEMFGRCYALEELDLSSFNTSKAKNGVQASGNGHTTGTFRNFCNDCRNLKWIKLGPNFAINGDGTNTTAEYKLILPTPSTDYIDGADGMWYTFNGDAYEPAGIPDRTANTYYASYGMVADVDVIVKNGSLIDAAKAIREKNGVTDHYTPAQFGAAIRAL